MWDSGHDTNNHVPQKYSIVLQKKVECPAKNSIQVGKYEVCSLRECRKLDVDLRTCSRPFPWVGPVHVGVGPTSWIHVPVAALFRVFDMYT